MRAQAKDGSLSVLVSQSLTGDVIEQRDDATDVNINVTIPANGPYTVTINRYRYSPFVIFLAPADAYIFVKTAITETRFIQDYRTVTTYPYKELLIPGIAIIIASIGFGIISIAQQSV